jgi:hypothetical protein
MSPAAAKMSVYRSAHKRYPALDLTVIHAQERSTPKGRKPIEWKLITDLPVRSRKDAIEKLHWYALRWKIEVFHKILKSGCKAEESKLRTAGRLANLISVFCILSWRVFWLTMLNRSAPNAPPQLALTDREIRLLDHLVKNVGKTLPREKTLSKYTSPSGSDWRPARRASRSASSRRRLSSTNCSRRVTRNGSCGSSVSSLATGC